MDMISSFECGGVTFRGESNEDKQGCNFTDLLSPTMHSSVAPGFSRLSQELIDEIVDYYFILNDGNDYKEHEIAIKECPLISRAFRDRSQLLFTKLFFVMDDESQAGLERLKRLNDVFSTNPRLASHVRVLTLRVKDSSDLWNPCFENRILWNIWVICRRVASDNSHPTWRYVSAQEDPVSNMELLQ